VCVIEQTPAGAVCHDSGRLRKSRSAGRRRNRRYKEFFRNLNVAARRLEPRTPAESRWTWCLWLSR